MRVCSAKHVMVSSGRWLSAFRAMVLTSLLVGSASAGPMDISGLALWLEADTNVTKDGNDRVSVWGDIIGAGNNTVAQNVGQDTSGSRPLWVSNGIGGRPAIRFNGTAECLNNTSDNLLASGAARTVIMVGDANDSSVGGPIFVFRRNGSKFNVTLTHIGSGFISYGDGVHTPGNAMTYGTEADAALATIRNPFISVHASAGGFDPPVHQLEVEFNGNPLTITHIGVYPETGPTGFSIGRYEPLEVGWPGLIAEVLVYDRKLSDSEVNSIGWYLGKKYDIQTAYVPEPGGLVLLAMGIVALGPSFRRQRVCRK